MIGGLLCFIATHAVAAEPTLLFDSGKEGYPRYRIPSLALLPGGTLLAVCEGRVTGKGLTGDIDLVARRSRDGGMTWTDLATIVDDGVETLGNPCLVVDQQKSRVWLAYTRSLGRDTEEEIVAGTSGDYTRVFVTSSDDDGVTWSKRREITDTVRRSDWTWYGTGPGLGLQLREGRLVVPSYHATAKTGVYRSHMVYSDDHGQTWQRSKPIGNDCSECHVVATANGDLVLNSRTTVGPDQRTVARSQDGGVTWTNVRHEPLLYDSHCQACVISLPATDQLPARWLFTHPAGPDRRNLTARVSYDDGVSWPQSHLIQTGDSQYSCLALLPDGHIGCLYESWQRGNYRLYFTRLDQTWMTGR